MRVLQLAPYALLAALFAALLTSATAGPTAATSGDAASSPETRAYLHVAGVMGGSTDAGFVDWILADRWSWGENRLVDPNRAFGRLEMLPLVVEAHIDPATVPLLAACAEGKRFPTATLKVVQLADEVLPFFDIHFSEVSCMSANVGDGDGSPGVAYSFNYAKIEWTYYKHGPEGQPEGVIKAGYDLKSGKKT